MTCWHSAKVYINTLILTFNNLCSTWAQDNTKSQTCVDATSLEQGSEENDSCEAALVNTFLLNLNELCVLYVDSSVLKVLLDPSYLTTSFLQQGNMLINSSLNFLPLIQ